ncbi:glycosyltransferase family 4 protein [Ancylobacter sonchi]|uniref:glycosyltransferase family 4 protein n=1 Tax=Ancylobacter sonchi TaxID=1937790 RepID=UPI001BD3DE10|nr:glycosyltransferase family 4 protein [Ancylobacter sonchi]MBS7534426.1 glycosyltransferase family 4 protein [Ancylobacter sonchi]
MKIVLFVHCYFPDHFYGTESYTRVVARNLRELGHTVKIVTATFAGESAQTAFIEEYEWEGTGVLRFDRNLIPNRVVRDTYYMPELRTVLERILRREKPDVVHVCHLVNHTTALLEVLDSLGIPTVGTFTDFYGICFNNKLQTHNDSLCLGPDRYRTNCLNCFLKEVAGPGNARLTRYAGHRALRPISSRVARFAMPTLKAAWREDIEAIVERPAILADAYGKFDAAVAPTRFLHDAYRRNGFEGRLEISHFGIDIDRAPKPERTDGKIHFGFIGQLARHKGVHLLVEALEAIAHDKARLSIWGSEQTDRAYSIELRRKAAWLPVSFQGTFPVEEMAQRLAEIDVLVIPSIWYENSPLILLQALATHTPVIIADVAGMTEFVPPLEYGVYFARGSATSLAAAMEHFTRDPTLARAMSRRIGYERTTRHMVDDLMRIYEEVA